MERRELGVWIIATILLVTLAATLPASGQRREKSIRVRLQTDMDNVDPANIGKSDDHALGYLIYNGLVRYKVGGLDVVPDLATGWDVGQGGRVYTFRLRRGVKWHKGYGELTADDVVYTILRIKDPATRSRFQTDYEIVDKVEAIDRYTVRITLKEPFSPFLSAVLAFRPGWIVNKKAVDEKGRAFGVDPIGTGPYMFDRRSRGSEVVLRRNLDYFESVDIDTVVLKVIRDDTVAELALMNGDVDVAYIFEGESASRLLKDKSGKIEAKKLPGYRTQWVSFNLARPAVKDIRVRKALVHAINKRLAAWAVYTDLGSPVSSIFNPNIPGYVDPDPFPYNADRARQLLKEAGVTNGLTMKVLVMPTRGWPEMAAVLQDQWKRVGVTADLIIRERAVYDHLSRGADYDIHAQNISRADAYQYAAFFFGPNMPYPNTVAYSGTDAIIRAAAREADDAKRIELWKRFQQRLLVDDVVGFGMTNVKYVLAWRGGIRGVDAMYQDSYPIEKMRMD